MTEKLAKCFVILTRLPNRYYTKEEAETVLNASIAASKNNEAYLLELVAGKKKIIKEDFVDLEVEEGKNPTIGEQQAARDVVNALDRAHAAVRDAARPIVLNVPVENVPIEPANEIEWDDIHVAGREEENDDRG